MAVVNILRNINLFVDGRGYAGRVAEVELPELSVMTEEYRAGGMDAPIEIDLGLEKLECSWSMSSIDDALLKRWGLAPGSSTPVTFRAALESEDGTVTAVEVRCRGQVKTVEPGTWKPGENRRSSSRWPFAATCICRGGRRSTRLTWRGWSASSTGSTAWPSSATRWGCRDRGGGRDPAVGPGGRSPARIRRERAVLEGGRAD